MSDDILSVATNYPDVAGLAQGYMNRADGERLLLPLAAVCTAGSGVRFVVYLSDGTPAFAGAGLCVQVSDQGNTVPPEQRYETLLDTLQFDARSRPVYDYIVAVRSAAYAQPSSPSNPVTDQELAHSLPAPGYDDDATSILSTPPLQIAGLGQASEAESADFEFEAEPVVDDLPPEPSSTVEADVPFPSTPAPPTSYIPAQTVSFAPPSEVPGMPSFIPPPVPTGLLSRPARATAWQPAPPRRPTPRIATGLFRYGPGALPRPARPPRPELDPALQVRPAPRPA
jgi:hypothetical protein